jgi:hypothetical protein
MISASTVGLPRESKISRAVTEQISLMITSLLFSNGRTMPVTNRMSLQQ